MKGLKLIDKKKNVYIPKFDKILIGNSINKFLIKNSKKNNFHKAMVLIHKNKKNKFQEMLICLSKKKKYKPHINFNSDKSYQIIVGKMKITFFSKTGKINEELIIDTKKNNFLRFKKKIIHTVEALTDYIIYYERVLGPHNKTKYFGF